MIVERKIDCRGVFEVIRPVNLIQDPVVSVVMSVFNGQRYLRESIESILSQSYSNFEFLIVDDGSEDVSLDIIKEYQENDNRVVIIKQENIGLTKSLNRGVENSRGLFVARQDADDLSMKDRLDLQLRYLDSEGVDIVGSDYIVIDDHGFELSRRIQCNKKNIWLYFILGNQLAHGSVMFNKEVLLRMGGYDEKLCCSQDYDLWMRALALNKYSIGVVEGFLYMYRSHARNISHTKKSQQKKIANSIRLNFLKSFYG